MNEFLTKNSKLVRRAQGLDSVRGPMRAIRRRIVAGGARTSRCVIRAASTHSRHSFSISAVTAAAARTSLDAANDGHITPTLRIRLRQYNIPAACRHFLGPSSTSSFTLNDGCACRQKYDISFSRVHSDPLQITHTVRHSSTARPFLRRRTCAASAVTRLRWEDMARPSR